MNRVLLIVAVLLIQATSQLRAQTFTLDSFATGSGGGTSAGGLYSVSATIGDPVAGEPSGGAYSVASGFWSIVSLFQSPAAFAITQYSVGNYILSWASANRGVILQQSDTLDNPADWVDVTETVAIDGLTNIVQQIVPANIARRFYRLRW